MTNGNIKKDKFDLNPFPSKGKIYGKVTEFHKIDEEQSCHIRMSLVNDKMLEYDKEYLNEEAYKSFHMYFYFLEATIKSIQLVSLMEKRNYDGYFVYEIQRLDETNVLQFELKYENEDNWFIGNIQFSSSPTTVEKYLIKVTNSTYPFEKKSIPLPTDCVIYDMNDLKKKLDYIFPSNILSIDYKIFHVGQGHNSYINFNKNCGGFFDLGYTTSYQKDRSHKSSRFIKKDPMWVILSHWDLDHFLGVTLFDDTTPLQIPWIAPALIDKDSNAERLAKAIYYYSGRQLYLIDDSLNNQIVYTVTNKKSHVEVFSIAKGNGIDKNNSGLVIFINNKKKMISMGDLSYKDLITPLPFSEIDFIVIPHHGGNVEGQFPFHPKDKSLAIIPVGHNSYYHPREKNVKMLKKIIDVHRTDWNGEITITL